jgi:mRNA-degrading endonuclease RelE of RelBE toxin-antitoxin system
MHTVIETPGFLRDAAAAGLTDDKRRAMVAAIADDPTRGDVMAGTGGARKVRLAGRGKGKSGGYRVVTYYAAPDVPVLMLAVYGRRQVYAACASLAAWRPRQSLEGGAQRVARRARRLCRRLPP